MYRISDDEYEIIQNHRKKNLKEKEEEDKIIKKKKKRNVELKKQEKEEILEKIRIKKMLERNKKYNEHLMQFIEERIDKAEETERLSYNTIWNEYKCWCKKYYFDKSKKPFEKQLFRGEIEKIYGKMNTTKGWKGLKIRSVEVLTSSDDDE